MKVLYVINGLGTGGAERSLSEMAPGLHSRGIELIVACLFARELGVQEAAEQAGLQVVVLKSSHWLGRARELRAHITRLRPDIIHTTLFESDVLGRLANVGVGAKVATSLVNTSYAQERLFDENVTPWKLRIAKSIDSFTARRLTDRFHAISHTVAHAAVRDLRISADLIDVIPRGRSSDRLGVPSDERRRRARLKLGIEPDAEVVTNVGRQEFQKGQIFLVRAAQVLAEERPNLHVLIVGRAGNASSELLEAISQGGHTTRITVMGHREDVPDILAASDVFVFPSLFEGLGGSAIEAMALGLPLIVSDAPALLEVVDPGGNAAVTGRGESTELAERIRELLDNPELRLRWGVRSRALYEQNFSLDTSISRMCAFYTRVSP